jgi:hypothetical protein
MDDLVAFLKGLLNDPDDPQHHYLRSIVISCTVALEKDDARAAFAGRILRDVGAIYADRPGYLEAWRP